MLLSKSPVRSISEKLKSPQASIKDMKIERKKHFRSFLKYIERESKELEKIKLPARNEVTKKSGSGGIGALLGFGALGLLGLLGGMGDKGNMYKYGDKNLGGNIFKGPYAVGRKGGDDDQKIDDPDITRSDFPNIRDFTSTSAAFKNAFQFGSVKAATLKETTIEDVTQTESFQRRARNITKQYSATTQGGERVPTIEDLRQEQTGGGDGGGSGKKIIKPKPGEIEKSINIVKKFPEQLRLFEDKDKNVPDDGGKAGQARIEKEYGLSDSERVTKGLGDADPGKQLKGQFSDLKTKRENVVKNKGKKLFGIGKFIEKFMNFYNKGRNVRFPDENKAKLIDLIKDDFSQVTYSDSAFKSGKKGFFNLRPFKAFSLDMMKTGPTPLTRQIIERPFKSLLRAGSGVSKMLFKNPLVNALLKSKVTKTGLFVIDAVFAGQEFYDLFMRPGDNVYTSLHDLYVSINNAYFQNDPEKLKYFITESKGSSKLFGIGPGLTNEQIRKKEIERNLKIKRLKEAAAVEAGSGGNNIIVVPQSGNKRGSGISNNSPTKTGGNEISFVPFEPLNIGDDILLHKLNQ